MILLTGAAGKTGKAILNTLVPHGVQVRSLVQNEQQAEEIKNIGATDIIIGDLRDSNSLAKAMTGIKKIYYICPNMAPDELEIGRNLIHLASKNGITRFIYHSVLHPQAEDMPHHWQKLRMEELLFKSGLDFTILQPCAYMQNTLANWQEIVKNGIYAIPYATSARISMVDLMDVAAIAEVVLTQRNHSHTIYELAGPEHLSQVEVAEILSAELGRPVQAITLARTQWTDNVRKSGLDERQINTLLRMFEYYENYGLQGNATILTCLLKRPATKFAEFVRRTAVYDQRLKSNGQIYEESVKGN